MDPTTAAAGMQALGSIISGIAGSKDAKAQAQIAGYNADAARQMANLDVFRVAQQGRAIQGAARASIAANGLVLDGSAQDIMENNAVQNKMDQLLAKYSGDLKAWGYSNQQNALKAQANNSMISGFFQAAGSIYKASGSSYLTDDNSLSLDQPGWYSTQAESDAAASKAGITWYGN